MRVIQRAQWVLLLFMLFALPTSTFAQDEEALTLAGSALAQPLFEAVADAAEADLTLNADTTGTPAGYEALCAGEADIALATRPMSVEEESTCTEAGVEFVEVRLGYTVLAYIVNPELALTNCVTADELDDLLAPSAAANTLWADVFADAPADAEVSVTLPPADTLAFALLDEITAGAGFRADASLADDVANIAATVADTAGGFGVVPLSAIDDTNVQLLQLRNNDIAACVEPSAETISDESYPAGLNYYAYFNAETLSANEGLQAVRAFIADEASTETITAAGFTPLSTEDYLTAAEALATNQTGRQFSLAVAEFQIPPTVSGTVNIAGAAGAFSLVDGLTTTFTTQYTSMTINNEFLGEPDGLRRLCNSEVAMATTTAPPSDETVENCAAADINLVTVPMGTQATVLVANAADEHLACLTTEQIVNTWGAEAEAEAVGNWQAVDGDFPDQDFILFAGNIGNPIPNLMMTQAAGESAPLRADTESDTDPLYRAAAVANVEGSLTYMSWGQYQDVLANNQERIQLVAVDGGDGCITPTQITIDSGEYPLARTLYLVISETALSRIEVQSLLWFMFQDANFPNFERANFDTLNLNDLEGTRATLQDAFDAANAAAAARLVEEADATEEPAEDGTAEEATEEPTDEE